uniref:Methyltransferase domain-containing protein n=1 Tax=Guillardia theta TaxID=55529 RepID=A0A7S4L0L9_GUITH
MLEELAGELDDGCFIEIGSDRGEGSTKFLSDLANRTNRCFYSVDFSVEGYENALATCGSCAYQDMGERWLGMSFEAVSNYSRIALAYLDNYDWTYPWTTEMAYKKQQHVDYASSGLKLSNQKSQEIHLQQAILVERLCSERCFILFDDTWPSASLKHHSGKGGRALSFLLSHGFEIIQQSAPNELSYLGYVLVRRLAEEERPRGSEHREEDDDDDEEEGLDGSIDLQVVRPEEGSLIHGDVLTMDVRLSGVRAGEHSLVFYDEMVERMRVNHWEDMQLSCEEGGNPEDRQKIQPRCYREFPLVMYGVRAGRRLFLLEIIDRKHRSVTNVSRTLTFHPASPEL